MLDTSNAKKYYQSIFKNKNKKLEKRAIIITEQPKF